MVTLMQRSPSLPDEPSASTHDGIVLQNVAQRVIHNAVQDTNQVVVSGEQLSQYFTQYYSTSDLNQAVSCLYTGIGIELWSLEKLWPGICQDLWWYNYQHPDTLSSATSAAIVAMTSDTGSKRRKFDCPVFVAEMRNGWPRTCNNYKGANMADVRRHLTTRPGRGYLRQLSFLELCVTCNDDFIDREVFESRHGYRGEFCNNRQPGRRGAKAQAQWELLYRQVEAAMSSQRLSTQHNENNTALLTPNTGFLTISVTGDDLVHPPTDQPIQHVQDDGMPYLTPYQLIVESDSDEARPDTELEHTLSRESNELKETPVSQTWPEIEHTQSDVFDRDSWTPASIPSNRALESEEVESRSRPNTNQAISHDIFIPVSESTSLMTAAVPSRTRSPVQENEPLIRAKSAESQQSRNLQPVDAESERGSQLYPGLYSAGIQEQESFPFKNIKPPDQTLAQLYQESCDNLGRIDSLGHLDSKRSDRSRVYRRVPRYISNPPVPQYPETRSSSTPSSDKHGSSPNIISCPECDQRFTGRYRTGNLTRHRRSVHMVGQTFTCRPCQRTYMRKDALLKHTRKHHPPHGPINSTGKSLFIGAQRENNLYFGDRMEVD